MKFAPLLRILMLMFALNVDGCVAAQSKVIKPMLIDKIPAKFWDNQIDVPGDKYKEQKELMVNAISQQLKGAYKIVDQRFYELLPYHGIRLLWPAFKMNFHNAMNADLHTDPIYENSTGDDPYITVWKTRDAHPEYAVIALGNLPNLNSLLGYFELAPE